MTTAQESTNGHRVFPLPCSFPDSQEVDRSKDSTNSNSSPAPIPPTPATEPFAASSYHVPPSPFTPSTKPNQPGEYAERAKRLGPLPERCQFMFSDGRQCTMARSDIHPSLCTYHSDREQQLFGDPSCRCEARTLDFPELYSACRDLTTASGVNRALAQVFRLLAQRRISRQEAATFAKLAHLLKTISAARSESPDTDNRHLNDAVILSEQRRISPELPPDNNGPSRRQPISTNLHPCAPPITSSASSEPLSEPITAKNSFAINTSATSVCNSREINTSENVELNPVQNQHLQKKETRLPVALSPVTGLKPNQPVYS